MDKSGLGLSTYIGTNDDIFNECNQRSSMGITYNINAFKDNYLSYATCRYDKALNHNSLASYMIRSDGNTLSGIDDPGKPTYVKNPLGVQLVLIQHIKI